MKINSEDYSKLQAAILPYLTQENWEAYQRHGLSETRFLFDALDRSSRGTDLLRDLYQYLDDNNVHTALRRIWRQVPPQPTGANK